MAKKKRSVRRADRVAQDLPLAERRQLRVHPQIVFDMIFRQAGSLSKALLEGVMNSVDARAKRCDITLKEETATVADDGVGFRSYQEIIDWFEEFGRPHEEQDTKTFGRFHMGRGQLFAYGKNTWRTGKFQMELDCKANGLDYDLKDIDTGKAYKGCEVTVDLYEKLIPSAMEEAVRELKIACRWAPLPVFLNGEQISNDPAEFDWTEETEEAYIELNDQPVLRLYNQGIFVCEYSKHSYGTGGEVVTKVGHELEVNFARNAVQSTCPIWTRLKRIVDQRAKETNIKKSSIGDGERTNLRRKAKTGEIKPWEMKDLKIFQAVTGRQYTLQQVAERGFSGKWTVAPKGDRIGDNIHRAKMAFVLADCVLDDMAMTPEQFQEWASKQTYMWKAPEPGEAHPPTENLCWYENSRVYVPFETISAGMDNKFELLDEDKLKPREWLWLKLLDNIHWNLNLSDEDDKFKWKHKEYACHRKIKIGYSEAADGWTDAATYIAISRDFLEGCDFKVEDFVKVGDLLLHECCHRQPDLEDHDHDQAFYELYHDSMANFMGEFLRLCLKRLPDVVKRNEKKLTKQQLNTLDTVAIAEQTDEKVDKLAAKAKAKKA